MGIKSAFRGLIFLPFLLLFFFPSFMFLLSVSFKLPIHQDRTSAIFRTSAVLLSPLCGSSRPSPRSGQSEIQAHYLFHLMLRPLLCRNSFPMLPVRLHHTAVKHTRNFTTCLSPSFVLCLASLPPDQSVYRQIVGICSNGNLESGRK
jgi:hypothetical protein